MKKQSDESRTTPKKDQIERAENGNRLANGLEPYPQPIWSSIPTGKHQGKTAPEIAFIDPDYLFWA